MTALANAQQDAKPPQESHPIKAWLQSPILKERIAQALPKHCSPDRMMRIALTAVSRTPTLLDCDPNSFIRCLLDLSQWGLEPDGRHAHLIPFRNNKKRITECQLIIDYKGLVQLLYRAGETESVHADVVREGDDFMFNLGRVEKHVPWAFRASFERPEYAGPVVAAYCHVVMKGGAIKDEVMTFDEIEAIRRASPAGNSGPWVDHWPEMAKKTVFRRATKWLPLSAEIIDAFDRDYDAPDFRRGGSTVTAGPRSLGDLSDRVLGSPEPNGDLDAADEPVDDSEDSYTPGDESESPAALDDWATEAEKAAHAQKN